MQQESEKFEDKEDNEEPELTKEDAKEYTKRAWMVGSKEMKYILLGSVGAFLAGIFFPVS